LILLKASCPLKHDRSPPCPQRDLSQLCPGTLDLISRDLSAQECHLFSSMLMFPSSNPCPSVCMVRKTKILCSFCRYLLPMSRLLLKLLFKCNLQKC
jgi:hypothetical protein